MIHVGNPGGHFYCDRCKETFAIPPTVSADNKLTKYLEFAASVHVDCRVKMEGTKEQQ